MANVGDLIDKSHLSGSKYIKLPAYSLADDADGGQRYFYINSYSFKFKMQAYSAFYSSRYTVKLQYFDYSIWDWVDATESYYFGESSVMYAVNCTSSTSGLNDEANKVFYIVQTGVFNVHTWRVSIYTHHGFYKYAMDGQLWLYGPGKVVDSHYNSVIKGKLISGWGANHYGSRYGTSTTDYKNNPAWDRIGSSGQKVITDAGNGNWCMSTDVYWYGSYGIPDSAGSEITANMDQSRFYVK